MPLYDKLVLSYFSRDTASSVERPSPTEQKMSTSRLFAARSLYDIIYRFLLLLFGTESPEDVSQTASKT